MPFPSVTDGETKRRKKGERTEQLILHLHPEGRSCRFLFCTQKNVLDLGAPCVPKPFSKPHTFAATPSTEWEAFLVRWNVMTVRLCTLSFHSTRPRVHAGSQTPPPPPPPTARLALKPTAIHTPLHTNRSRSDRVWGGKKAHKKRTLNFNAPVRFSPLSLVAWMHVSGCNTCTKGTTPQAMH